MVILVVVIAVFPLVLALFLTPITRALARRNGLLDKPDHTRKIHPIPVPRIGGLPVVLAFAISLGLVSLLLHSSSAIAWSLVPAGAIVFATGLIDDLAGLSPWQKLAGEVFGAALACYGMTRAPAGFHLQGYALVMAIAWLTLCMNAFNLIDGADGVAAGCGLLAAIAVVAAGILLGDTGMAAAAAALAGSLIGFLVFNFHPASIFLGDSGSLFVGFMLGCLGLAWAQNSSGTWGIAAPAIAFSIPLIDTGLSIARRFLRGQPIFKGDRGHIHHRLLDRGLKPRSVALRLYAAGALVGLLSLTEYAPPKLAAAGLSVFCAAVWMGIRYLGYKEFGILSNLFSRNVLLSMIRSQCALRDYEEALRSAESADDCWRALKTVGQELGFSHVALDLGGESHEEQLDPAVTPKWALQIPLSSSEYVQLKCGLDAPQASILMVPLAGTLHRSLVLKAAELERTRSGEKVEGAAVSGYSNVF